MRLARRVLESSGKATSRLRMEPSYLIVGAKRCGTTSLQSNLSLHPSVVPPHAGKGTHYFDENYRHGDRWFKAHFPTRATAVLRGRLSGSTAITGEASPYYCFHPSGFARIAARLPEARLIMVLRDPAERAFSHYQYEVRRGFETLPMHDALDAETDRLAGEEQRLVDEPSYVSHAHRHWSYFSRGLYAGQLSRALAHFPANRVLVLDFRELYSGDGSGLNKVFRFLRLAPVRLPRQRALERGAGRPMPPDIRRRLRLAYAEANEKLYEEFGVDFR